MTGSNLLGRAVVVNKRVSVLMALEMAIDMLDRVEGTEIYNIQKKFYGYSDQDWDEMLDHLDKMYNYLKKQRRLGDGEKGDN
jgi:hypothetical protein